MPSFSLSLSLSTYIVETSQSQEIVTTEFVGVRTPVELVEWLAQRTMTSSKASTGGVLGNEHYSLQLKIHVTALIYTTLVKQCASHIHLHFV